MSQKKLFTMNFSSDIYDKFSSFCDKIPCHKSDLILDLVLNYMRLHERKMCPYPLKKRNLRDGNTITTIRLNDDSLDILGEIANLRGIKRSALIRDILNDYLDIFVERRNASTSGKCDGCNRVVHNFTHCTNCFKELN